MRNGGKRGNSDGGRDRGKGSMERQVEDEGRKGGRERRRRIEKREGGGEQGGR